MKSSRLLHFGCGSCNDCDIEILATLTPLYDIGRFGMVNMDNAEYVDVLLVTGPANYPNYREPHNLYKQVPGLKGVIVVGICDYTGGIFHYCSNILGAKGQ
jgi:ech hydrogenase subunit C